ncbi:MAG: c-type cytochrome domain-containing protein [Polyangiales bacterium]
MRVTPTERLFLLAGWLAVAGCGGEACIDELACGPTETPSFDTLYAEVLAPSCAIASRSCHGPGGARTPSMVDAETARAELEAYVVPGRPLCSEVVVRVTSTEAGERMPPAAASRLASEDVCRLAAWIDALPE